MTKEEMLKEIKFPILTPRVNNFQGIHEAIPVPDAWILCFVDLKNHSAFPSIYKWQKENNPDNIRIWTYLNIESSTGLCRWIEYPHLKDDKVILICEEKDKDFIIEP